MQPGRFCPVSTANRTTARPGNASGRARAGRSKCLATGWHVRMRSGAMTEHHTTLRAVVEATEFDRTQVR